MNKALYLILIVGGAMLTALSALLFVLGPEGQGWGLGIAAGVLLTVVGNLSMIHTMWKAIAGPTARMSAAQAVGLLFIPLFNLYWIFQVFGGWAADYRAYAIWRGIEAPDPRKGRLVAYALFTLLNIPVVEWIVQALAIDTIADCINALPPRPA